MGKPGPSSAKVMPAGNAPVTVMFGGGYPVVVTVKLDATPAVNVVVLALVKAGTRVTVIVTVAAAELSEPSEAR